MTLTVIFRASDQSEVGPHAHLLHQGERPILAPTGDTVVSTLCGRFGIGPVVERPGPTCGECLAASGHHPGRRAKSRLRRQAHDNPRPNREDT